MPQTLVDDDDDAALEADLGDQLVKTDSAEFKGFARLFYKIRHRTPDYILRQEEDFIDHLSRMGEVYSDYEAKQQEKRGEWWWVHDLEGPLNLVVTAHNEEDDSYDFKDLISGWSFKNVPVRETGEFGWPKTLETLNYETEHMWRFATRRAGILWREGMPVMKRTPVPRTNSQPKVRVADMWRPKNPMEEAWCRSAVVLNFGARGYKTSFWLTDCLVFKEDRSEGYTLRCTTKGSFDIDYPPSTSPFLRFNTTRDVQAGAGLGDYRAKCHNSAQALLQEREETRGSKGEANRLYKPWNTRMGLVKRALEVELQGTKLINEADSLMKHARTNPTRIATHLQSKGNTLLAEAKKLIAEANRGYCDAVIRKYGSNAVINWQTGRIVCDDPISRSDLGPDYNALQTAYRKPSSIKQRFLKQEGKANGWLDMERELRRYEELLREPVDNGGPQ